MRVLKFNPGISFAVAAYALGLLGLAVFVVLVFGLGLGWLPPRPIVSGAWPWIVNGLWLVVFAAQHSGMARRGLKQRLGHVFPAHLQRSLYVGTSGLLLLGLSLTWQPLPEGPLWDGPPWLASIAALGVVATLACARYFDHLEFFGLREAWLGQEIDASELRIVGPYRWVRHPLMVSTLFFLWGHPLMSPTLFMLSAGLTLYIVVAIRWEERDLLLTFGEQYAAYRRKAPALVPWRGRCVE